MVLFDEQFVGGQSIYGQCENYRGALVSPDHILNITKKFESVIKKQAATADQVIAAFTEKDSNGGEEE